jgi:hypothetical protein
MTTLVTVPASLSSFADLRCEDFFASSTLSARRRYHAVTVAAGVLLLLVRTASHRSCSSG